MARISVVLPVRDVAALVPDVISDLRKQSFTDFEVVAIDDGSTDRTVDAITEAACGDRRIRVLSSSGSGASDARNTGIAETEGELLAFADADDRLLVSHFADLVEALDAAGAEMAICNARRLRGHRTGASGLHLRSFRDLPDATNLRASPQLVHDSTIWNKLSLRRLWADHTIRFPSGRWINDIHPSLSLHTYASQVATVRHPSYLWRERQQPGASITDSKYVDASALAKSWRDRVYALASARQTLSEASMPRSVLSAFDRRVLEHDFWSYLPLGAQSDDSFISTMYRDVADYLNRHDPDLDQASLGPLLVTIYRAARGGDEDLFTHSLRPSVRVVSRPRARGLEHRILDQGDGGPTSTTDAPRRWRRTRVPAQVDVILRAVEAADDGSPGSHILLTGEVQIRVGRSDAEGDWQVEACLQADGESMPRTSAVLPLGAPLPEARHPMLRDGWRSFHLALPLTPAMSGMPRTALEIAVRLGHFRITAPYRVVMDAARTLPSHLPVGDGEELVASLNGDRTRLSLGTTPARPRLAAGTLDRGALNLDLVGDMPDTADTDGVFVRRLNDGKHQISCVGSGRQRSFEVAELEVDAGARYGLFLDPSDGGQRRLRTTPDFREVGAAVESASNLEWSLRSTDRGNALVEVRQPRLLVERIVGDPGEADKFLLSGRFLHATVEPASIALMCHLDGTVASAPCSVQEDAWVATLHLSPLLAGPDGTSTSGRRLTLASTATSGRVVETRLTSTGRASFRAHAGSLEVILLPAGRGRAALDIRPVTDRS